MDVSIFDVFTDRARRCIFFARQSASDYGCQTIETEHFLLGILREDADVIGRFLPSRRAEDIRAEVEKHIAKPNVSTSIDPPLSLYCKRTIAYAAEEAERLSHRHINTDHLLIGVVREEDGMAGQILRSAWSNVAAMWRQMRLDEVATE